MCGGLLDLITPNAQPLYKQISLLVVIEDTYTPNTNKHYLYTLTGRYRKASTLHKEKQSSCSRMLSYKHGIRHLTYIHKRLSPNNALPRK
jgi:hypothetical protein